jgi:hypothetical protein
MQMRLYKCHIEIQRHLQLVPLLAKKSFFLDRGPPAKPLLSVNNWRERPSSSIFWIHATLEVKASRKISRNDFKGLNYLKEEGVFQNLILVSQDPVSTLNDGILTIPWQKFLSDLWKDKFV